MKKVLKGSLLAIIALFIFNSTAYAMETTDKQGDNVFFAVFEKNYYDFSLIPIEQFTVYIKAVYKPSAGFPDNRWVAAYIISEFGRQLTELGWKGFYCVDDQSIIYDYCHEWLAWARELSDDVVIEPDIGVNFKAENSLVLRSYVNICGYDPLWNMKKYRQGGYFEKTQNTKQKFKFTNQAGLRDYFKEVSEKLEGCIKERFPNWE